MHLTGVFVFLALFFSHLSLSRGELHSGMTLTHSLSTINLWVSILLSLITFYCRFFQREIIRYMKTFLHGRSWTVPQDTLGLSSESIQSGAHEEHVRRILGKRSKLLLYHGFSRSLSVCSIRKTLRLFPPFPLQIYHNVWIASRLDFVDRNQSQGKYGVQKLLGNEQW